MAQCVRMSLPFSDRTNESGAARLHGRHDGQLVHERLERDAHAAAEYQRRQAHPQRLHHAQGLAYAAQRSQVPGQRQQLQCQLHVLWAAPWLSEMAQKKLLYLQINAQRLGGAFHRAQRLQRARVPWQLQRQVYRCLTASIT